MLSDPFICRADRALLRRCRYWYALAVVLALFSVMVQQPLMLLTALFAGLHWWAACQTAEKWFGCFCHWRDWREP